MMFDGATIMLRSVHVNIRKEAQTHLHPAYTQIWASQTTAMDAPEKLMLESFELYEYTCAET